MGSVNQWVVLTVRFDVLKQTLTDRTLSTGNIMNPYLCCLSQNLYLYKYFLFFLFFIEANNAKLQYPLLYNNPMNI
mgnify:FL=1